LDLRAKQLESEKELQHLRLLLSMKNFGQDLATVTKTNTQVSTNPSTTDLHLRDKIERLFEKSASQGSLKRMTRNQSTGGMSAISQAPQFHDTFERVATEISALPDAIKYTSTSFDTDESNIEGFSRLQPNFDQYARKDSAGDGVNPTRYTMETIFKNAPRFETTIHTDHNVTTTNPANFDTEFDRLKTRICTDFKAELEKITHVTDKRFHCSTTDTHTHQPLKSSYKSHKINQSPLFEPLRESELITSDIDAGSSKSPIRNLKGSLLLQPSELRGFGLDGGGGGGMSLGKESLESSRRHLEMTINELRMRNSTESRFDLSSIEQKLTTNENRLSRIREQVSPRGAARETASSMHTRGIGTTIATEFSTRGLLGSDFIERESNAQEVLTTEYLQEREIQRASLQDFADDLKKSVDKNRKGQNFQLSSPLKSLRTSARSDLSEDFRRITEEVLRG